MSEASEERQSSEQEAIDVDGLLRRLSRAMPRALVEAIIPGSRFMGWEDTQLASRQRRMDRCFLVRRGDERIRVHLEWQTEWKPDVPMRVFEYQVLDVLAALESDANAERTPQVRLDATRATRDRIRIESHVVLLTGREELWPDEMEFRLSPDDASFTGIRFRLHAVYQRTVAELLAQGPLFAIFAPLARDASAEQAESWLRHLRRSTHSKRQYTELASAMLAMGSVDRRQRHLDQAILRLLPEEIQLNNPLYNLGLDHGLQRGREQAQAQAQALKQAMDALRFTVADLCEAFEIELNDARRAQLEGLDLDGLNALRLHLKAHHAWPQTEAFSPAVK